MPDRIAGQIGLAFVSTTSCYHKLHRIAGRKNVEIFFRDVVKSVFKKLTF